MVVVEWPGSRNSAVQFDAATKLSENYNVANRVGLWRSWERASMAWKRSSVRSRPGPPSLFMMFARLLTPATPAPPQSGIPLPAPSADASDATDPLRCSAATAPQNYQWRAYRYLLAVPTLLPKSPCAKLLALHSPLDNAEIPPPSPSGGLCFPTCAVPALRSRSSCRQN